MELRKIVDDIKLYIDAETVKNKIATDLGLSFKNDKCLCFIHSESNPSMSFDKRKKKFRCFSCGSSYDIFNHYQEHHNKSFIEAVKSIISDFNMNIDLSILDSNRKPKKPPTTHNSYNDKVLGYCEKRSISKSTIDYVGVKENDNNICFEYRNELGEHIANKYRRTKTGKGPKMWFEKDTNINTLFNMDKVNVSEPLLITEGEFDCLATIESGFKNAVSIPSGVNGTNEWITTNWNWLDQFEEVILWFDNDEAGIKGVREVSNRLTNNVVKVVNCKEANDINELLHREGKKKVLEYINKASTPIIDGVATLDSIEDFNIYEAEKLEMGIPNIDDEIIGLCYGTLNVFSGRNGAGKSTILNQIYAGEAIRQGQKVFIFSGELEASNVKEWLIRTLANEQQLMEFTAKNDRTYKMVSSDGKRYIVDCIKDKVFIYDDESYNIDHIITKMKQLYNRFGVRVFIIDNLMTVEGVGNDEYKQQTDIVRKLKNFAKKNNVIVHLVAHPRKSQNQEINKDDVAGSANITNLADYVTTIERNFEDDRMFDAKLSILKNRHTGVNASAQLKFDMDRKRFYSSSQMVELQTNFIDNFEQIEGDWE